MINYEYLKYWSDTVKSIDLLHKLIQTNISEYIRTQNIEYLEYIINNAEELKRLRIQKEEYYLKAFNTT